MGTVEIDNRQTIDSQIYRQQEGKKRENLRCDKEMAKSTTEKHNDIKHSRDDIEKR